MQGSVLLPAKLDYGKAIFEITSCLLARKKKKFFFYVPERCGPS